MAVICQSCQQRPATLHVTQLDADATVRDVHVCATCSDRLDIQAESVAPDVIAISKRLHAPRTSTTNDATCSACGLTLAEYRSSNVLGCANCWSDLLSGLLPLVKRFHDADHHHGRGPARTPDPLAFAYPDAPVVTIRVADAAPAASAGDHSPVAGPAAAKSATGATLRRQLQRQLAQAVTAERYEEAAQIRDRLKELS